jgi:hypothetical protein
MMGHFLVARTKLNAKILSAYFVSPNTNHLVTDYGLDDRVRSPTEAEDFSSSLCVQTGSGAHPDSCTMGTGGSFPRG